MWHGPCGYLIPCPVHIMWKYVDCYGTHPPAVPRKFSEALATTGRGMYHDCLVVQSLRIHGAGIFTYIGIILNYFRGQCR